MTGIGAGRCDSGEPLREATSDSVRWQEMTSGRFDLQDVGLLWHGGTEAGKATESRADAEESVCRWTAQKQGRGWERGSQFLEVKMLVCEKQTTMCNSVWTSECEHVSSCVLER